MKITPHKILRFVRRLPQTNHPLRTTLALLLQATGLSRAFVIQRPTYRLRFFPDSALSRSMWINPRQTRHEETFVRKYLQAGDTMIDIGANVGTVVFSAATQVKNTGLVVAVEPHPRIFSYLTGNNDLNHFTNIEFVHAAVGQEEGIVQFSDKGSDDRNQVLDSGNISVPLTTLDALVEKLGISHIDLLKIDVEGYEKNVLLGAAQALQITQCVFIETLESNLQQFGTSAAELYDILWQHGFQMFYIFNSQDDTLALRDPVLIEQRLGDLMLTPIPPANEQTE